MKRSIVIAFAILTACAASAQTWYDLTVHNAVFNGTNLVSGDIHPAGLLPTMEEFNSARADIADAYAVALDARSVAEDASNRAARAYSDVVDTTSNGVWQIAFTLSALKGVGASDDITSEMVGFSTEATATNRICHVIQWFSSTPTEMPDFSATYTTNLLSGFETITVTNSFPTTVGQPSDYGKDGGACYRVDIGVPSAWGSAFFKVTASGFILRGNSMPIVGGVMGGANYDIVVQDAATLSNVVLNIRGGFVVDTNNAISLLSLEVQ